MNHFLLPLGMALITVLSCNAQNKTAAEQIKNPNPSAQSMLWKVEGKGIQPSYVFGTFHLLPQADFELKDHVKRALIDSEQLVLELDMDDPNMQMDMMQSMNMKDATKLSDLITPADFQLVKERLLSSTGMPLEMMDRYKPFFVSTMLQFDFIEGDIASFEGSLMQLAIEQEKEVLGLETVGEQMRIFDSIPYQKQADDLVEMLKEDRDMKTLFDEMIQVYKAEDIEALDQTMHKEMDDPLEFRLLITDRNQRWIERIGELAASKSSFIGVGAGHLGGEQGVIQLLRDAGYEVEPVLE